MHIDELQTNYFCISLPLFLLQTFNNDLIESIPKIDPFSITPIRLHFRLSSILFILLSSMR